MRPSEPRHAPTRLTLVTGTEAFLIGRAVARAVGAARAARPEVERRDVAADSPGSASELLAALSPSLFGEAAVVVVSGLADATEATVAVLVDVLADPPEDTWVVALHTGSRNRAALDRLRALDLPGGVTEVACTEVKRGRPTRELLEQEARRSGRRITGDGVDALVMALGADVALLVGALEQLVADCPDDPIDASVVTATFAGVAEVSGFQLADALWEGNGLLALQRLRWGLDSQTMTPAGAVGAIAAGLRSMVRAAGAPRQMAEADVARLAGVPPFKVRQLRAAASRWDAPQLAAAVRSLAEVDAQVKGGLRPGESLDTAQKLRALEAFIIATVGLRDAGAAPAAGTRPRRSG